MTDINSNTDESVDSNLCKMIAWLSVCVLAAAWGSNLDPEWRPAWRLAGLFGLVSAVGLSVARRAHAKYRHHCAQRSVESQLTRRLASELFTSDASDHLRPIVERFFADFEGSGNPQSDRRLGTDQNSPAQLFALDSCSNPNGTQLGDEPLVAHVRNISLSGIGLSHGAPLAAGPVLLTYETQDGARLAVGVEISWCRPSGRGQYISGGKFVEFSHAPAMLDEQACELQTA